MAILGLELPAGFWPSLAPGQDLDRLGAEEPHFGGLYWTLSGWLSELFPLVPHPQLCPPYLVLIPKFLPLDNCFLFFTPFLLSL